MSEPHPREAAPPGLLLVQEFVNSVELPDGADELGTPREAAAWLSRHGVRAGRLREEDRGRLIEAREALRAVLAGHTGCNVDAASCVRLQDLLGRAPLRAVVSPQGAMLVCDASGVDAFLGRISAAIALASQEAWERLKVCRSDACRWAFYDHSKNGRGAWCSMRVCGSREKARAYRERKRQVGAGRPVDPAAEVLG